MPAYFLFPPLMIDSPWLVNIIYIFIAILIFQTIAILIIALDKKTNEKNIIKWKELLATQISQTIFYEGTPEGLQQLILIPVCLQNKKKFRQLFTDEIIQAKKSFTGTPHSNLILLYRQFNLYKDSHKKLHNRKWHVKAKGIQELAMMEQTMYVKEFFRLSNNKNHLLRNEAQCGLVSLYGFPGLRFLNVTTQPVSEWQQIQLLNKLNEVTAVNLEPMKKWLQSSNESVIIFSIKLAAFYKCYSLYSNVLKCLQHPSTKIKLITLEYLKNMPGEDTCNQVITSYFSADKICRLAILDILIHTGSKIQIPFLLTQLQDADDDIKAATAKTISALHPLGPAFLQTQRYANLNPWKTIFLQINQERVA